MNTRTWKMRVNKYMEQYHMTESGDGILAAVSGGADSVCLLLVLKALEQELGVSTAAFHMNHGLRGEEADRDEAYVQELCARLQVPLKTVREDVARYAKEHGLSEEEAGRTLRYRYLETAAIEFDCRVIATAHHQDDQVETVLMNLFRGSGLRGLGGIRPVREMLDRDCGDKTEVDKNMAKPLRIIRPLMCMTRKEIETYLIEEKVHWCEDSTNRENVYARNKVRNVLMPWLREHINDQAEGHILKAAAFAEEADVYFAGQAEKILDEEDSENGASQRISVKRFDAEPEILQTYLVRAMIMRVSHSAKDISSRHLESICSLTGPGGGTHIDLPYGLTALRGYEYLEIQKKNLIEEVETGIRKGSNVENSLQMEVFPWKKDLEIPKNQYTKWFDYDKIKDTLSVRTREAGDYIMIAGGKTKKLNRYFIDEKIPEEERDRIWLLAEGSHILWIIGYRISDYYKITEKTCTILEVQADEGEKHG